MLISVNYCVLNIVLGTKQKNKSSKTAQAVAVDLSHTDAELRPSRTAVGPYVRPAGHLAYLPAKAIVWEVCEA